MEVTDSIQSEEVVKNQEQRGTKLLLPRPVYEISSSSRTRLVVFSIRYVSASVHGGSVI